MSSSHRASIRRYPRLTLNDVALTYRSVAPSNRIELFRNASGFSRAYVADQLNVTERTVYRWERGEVQIPDEQKLALTGLFGGVSVVLMMGWEGQHDGDGDGGLRKEKAA